MGSSSSSVWNLYNQPRTEIHDGFLGNIEQATVDCKVRQWIIAKRLHPAGRQLPPVVISAIRPSMTAVGDAESRKAPQTSEVIPFV